MLFCLSVWTQTQSDAVGVEGHQKRAVEIGKGHELCARQRSQTQALESQVQCWEWRLESVGRCGDCSDLSHTSPSVSASCGPGLSKSLDVCFILFQIYLKEAGNLFVVDISQF